MTPGEWLRYSNYGAIRSQPLSPRLAEALAFLPEIGVEAEVFSGGQPVKGSGAPRTGSTRHDHGNAADVFFYRNGRRLDWSNPDDLPIFQDIVRRGRAAGLTGFGAGEGYMQPGSMHIGFGAPAVWGAGGRSANAPDWLREAYHGAPQGAPQSAPQGGLLTTSNQRQDMQGLLSNGRGDAGLLGGGGSEQVAEQPQTIGQRIRANAGDFGNAMAMAANAMRFRPDPTVAQALGQRAQARREDRLRTDQEKAAERRRNATIEALRQMGAPPELIALAEAGDGRAALAALAEARMRPAEGGYTQVRGSDLGMTGESAERLFNVGPDGKITGIGSAGQTINVNTGPDGIDYGSPGEGLVWARNADGTVQLDDRGAPVAIPFQGGSVFREQQEQQREQDAAREVETNREQNEVTQTNAALNAISDIRRLMAPKDTIAGRVFDLPETGVIGGRLGNMGLNQEATDVAAKLRTLESAVAFDRLQSMRDASPTGGALGAISERELSLLSSTLGSIDNMQSPDELSRSLDFIESVMRKAAAYPNASEYGFAGGAAAPAAGDEDDLTPDERRYLGLD